MIKKNYFLVLGEGQTENINDRVVAGKESLVLISIKQNF